MTRALADSGAYLRAWREARKDAGICRSCRLPSDGKAGMCKAHYEDHKIKQRGGRFLPPRLRAGRASVIRATEVMGDDRRPPGAE